MLRHTRISRYRLPRILFLGGDDVSVACLSALTHRLGGDRAAAECIEVVAPTAPREFLQQSSSEESTTSAAPASTSCRRSNHHLKRQAFPVVHFCRQRGIPCHSLDHPSSISKCTEVEVPLLHQRSAARFDLVVVASFRYFLPSYLLRELPPTINMHPSLLPKYRGASPIFTTVLRGESSCGASIIKLLPGELMDSGDILLQRQLLLQPQDDMRTIFPAVTRLGAACLLEVVFGDRIDDSCPSSKSIDFWNKEGPTLATSPPIWNGQSFSDTWSSAIPQTNKIHFKEDPFHAGVLDKNSSLLRFDTFTGLQCHNIWRAFVGGYFFKPAHCVMLKMNLAPAVRDQLVRRVRSSLARKRGHCDLDSISDADVVGELTVPFTVVEAVHPALVSSTVYQEISHKVVGVTAAAVPPGSAFFPKADSSIAAIACCRGNSTGEESDGQVAGPNTWFFWRVGTLKNSTPQCCDTMRKGLALHQGVLYERLFASVASA